MDYSQLSDFETNRMVGDIIFKDLWVSKSETSGNNTNKWCYGNVDIAFESLNHLPGYRNDPSTSWSIIEKYRTSTSDQSTEWCVDAKGVSSMFNTRLFRVAMIVFLLIQEANNAQPVLIPSMPERKHRVGFNVHRVDPVQIQCVQKTAGRGHVKQADAAYAKECVLGGMARTQVMWLKRGVIKA